MGGFALYGSYDDNTLDVEESHSEISTIPRHTIDVLKGETLIYIMKYFPHIITDIEEEYILDRAESSGLSKALLVVQVGWFCTNCASRLVQRLPLSLLEVSTAAHAFCTLLTYFIWWSKPINVAAPTLLRDKPAREVHALLKCSTGEYDKALEMAQKRAAGDSSTPTGTHSPKKIVLASKALKRLLPTPVRPPGFSRFGNHHMLIPGSLETRSPEDGLYEVITIATSPILYGLVHFLAWGDQFPTPLECLLWRVSSFVVTCSGIVGVAMTWSGYILDTKTTLSGVIPKVLAGFAFIIIPIAHVVASGFLIAESFRQLFFLDPATYQLPSWSNYWPHLS
jgi:hypothetical protein